MRVAFLGDSYVTGLGDHACLGWTGRLCAATARRGYRLAYHNLGVLRASTDELLDRIEDEVPRRLPGDVDGRLVVAPGISDVIVGLPLERSAANARSIGERTADRWPVIAVGPPPGTWPERNGRIHALSRALERGFQAAGVPFLEVFVPLLTDHAWIDGAAAYDGFHPSGEGYAAHARLVVAWSSWRAWFPDVLAGDIPQDPDPADVRTVAGP